MQQGCRLRRDALRDCQRGYYISSGKQGEIRKRPAYGAGRYTLLVASNIRGNAKPRDYRSIIL